MRSKKIILFSFISCFAFGFIGLAQMQTTQNNYANKTGEELVTVEEQIAAEEIGKAVDESGKYEPKIMPGTAFYPLKNLWREARVLFAKDANKKMDLRLKNSNEKILELNVLADAGKMDKVAKNLDNYAKELLKIGQLIGKTAGTNPQKAQELSEKMLKNQISHYIIGNKFEREAPVELLAKIRESKDKVIGSVGAVMSGFDSKAKMEKSADDSVKKLLNKGTEYKQIYALAALKTVEDKLSPEAKEAVKKINDTYTKNFNANLDRMAPLAQEKFADYASKNSGDDAVQMEIIDDLSITNSNDRSYKNISKVKENLYKDFNNKLGEAQAKAPEAVDTMLNRLENGDIKDLRIIREMEQNLSPVLVKNIINKTKDTSLSNLSSRLVKEDEKIFFEQASETADLKQLAVLNDVEKKISAADKPKMIRAREEIVKKIDYSASLASSELTSIEQGIVIAPQISEKEIMLIDCVSDNRCFNTKNINTEDIKIIEENKEILGAELAEKLKEINTARVITLIKNTDDIESLRKLEIKVKTNLSEKAIDILKDQFTNQTVIINTRAQDKTPEPLPPVTIMPKTEMIEACTKEYVPVCGDNRQTYVNACFAEKIAGVKIAYKGMCNSESAPTNITYPTISICDMQEFSPVCGTDKITYRSRCVAENFAKVKVDYEGKCAIPPETAPLPINIAPLPTTSIAEPIIMEPILTPLPSTDVYIAPKEYCGDKICQSAENQTSCPTDCGTIAPEPLPVTNTEIITKEYCGDKICNNNETYLTCLNDCPKPITTTAPAYYCGDKICQSTESKTSCPTDCGYPEYCGDKICNNGETSATCSGDCPAPVAEITPITTIAPIEPIINDTLLTELKPDLKPIEVSVSITSVKTVYGANIRNLLNFAATITNVGDKETTVSAASALKIDLFKDGTFDMGDTGAVINPLIPNASQRLYWSKYLDGSIGTHKVDVCADTNSQINEKDESNNCTSASFTISSETTGSATQTLDSSLYSTDSTKILLRNANPINRMVYSVGEAIKSFFLSTARAIKSF